jgi:hypothetical protein
MATPGKAQPAAFSLKPAASGDRGFASPSPALGGAGAATPETTLKAFGAPCDGMEVDPPAPSGGSIKLETPDTLATAPPAPAAPPRKKFGLSGFKGPSFVKPATSAANNAGGAGATGGASAEGASRLTYYEVPPRMQFVA